MQTSVDELLAYQKTIVTDGAMGTMLFAQGLEQGNAPERWNVDEPDTVRNVHRQYIQAGAQIILTNTFGGNRLRLGFHNLADRARELNMAAAHLARLEADAADNKVLVAGDVGPTGLMMAPMSDLSPQEASSVFQEQVEALILGGVDVIWIETMFDLAEVQSAIEAVRQVNPDFPIVTTMTFDAKGHTMMGTSPENAAETLKSYSPIALGGNCGNGIEEIITVVDKMHRANPELILVAKANAGIPRMDAQENPIYEATPQAMAAYGLEAREHGARIIGACCGSTPDHIRAIARSLEII